MKWQGMHRLHSEGLEELLLKDSEKKEINERKAKEGRKIEIEVNIWKKKMKENKWRNHGMWMRKKEREKIQKREWIKNAVEWVKKRGNKWKRKHDGTF